MKIKRTILVSFLIFSVNTFCQQIGDGRAVQITDLTIPLKSGVYQSTSGLGMIPDISHGWQHLFVVRHSNDTNDHQLQLSSSYSINDRLFFRKLAGSLEPMNPTWIELATRGANAFIGNQSIIGTIKSYETTPLNANINSFQLINEKGGSVGENSMMNRLWLLRDGSLNNWYTARLHDGVSVDTSFGNPHVDTRTWWERDPLDNIQSWGNAGDTYLTINAGNVGIGTTNPTSKLTVAGNINSREVKVTVDAGADFVFEKDYNLPSLASLDTYIKENKHLPEIASAKEMQENGINLSEMNIKLLQKIEEMTLYMIMQSQEIEALKKENKSFKSLSDRILKIERGRSN